ncbi:sensor histidine kinase [Kineosporia succinea]|uniref:histidine kinase n=1 Tax=Kineosporia succinea TaxID=84632 RepID=A0ABT9P158_9ACTN|nr:histidine kinase [Kineosporia succinea]MDP9825830.1 signal transduction histidine kinase [Kineosporia succinea]
MRTTSLAPTSQQRPPPLSPSRQWSHTLAVTGALTLLGAFVFGPLWREYPEVAAGSILFTAMFSGAGAILWSEPGHRRTAVLLVLAGQFWALGWSEEWRVSPFPLVSGISSYVALSLAVWAMFRYPDPALMNRVERVFVRVLAVTVIGGILAETVTMRPEWKDYDPGTLWITLHADRALHDAIGEVMQTVQVLLVAGFLLLWMVRIRRMRGLDRELLAPMALAAPAAGLAAAAVPVARLFGLSGTRMDTVYAFQPAVLAVVPLAFLVSVVRRRLADNAVLTLIQQVQRRPTPEAVQTALRTALRDATLRVRYWAPDLNAYVDVTGTPIDEPVDQSGGDRLELVVTAPAGGPLAVIDADAVLRRHPHVVSNALAASGLALENAQLQAAVLGRLSQVRQVRMQAVQAGVAERRRVERDLHDGAQQRLLALRLVLAASDSPDLSDSSRERLRSMSHQIALALNELRDLARGIHPAVLSQAGLSAAIEAMAQQQPLVVDADLPAGRFPAATEETAYYLICAALKGAAEQSGARVSIRGHETDGVLTIEVEDDGRRPAQMRLDAELPGMLDRVRALGGDIMFSTLSRGGSLMVAAIPCA